MAVSRISSAGSDVLDVTELLCSFEEQNSVMIEIRLSRVGSGQHSDLMMVMVAHAVGAEIGVAPPLASVNVRCLALNRKKLEAAVIHGLYLLDFQLAQNELEGGCKK